MQSKNLLKAGVLTLVCFALLNTEGFFAQSQYMQFQNLK